MTNYDDHRRADVLARLDAMRSRESTCAGRRRTYREMNPRADVDESCRAAMVAWLRQVQGALSLSPETVRIAVPYLDRYLGSGAGRSPMALESRREFQLAAITCFYTAIKIHEPVALGTGLLAEVCHGTYEAGEIEMMEVAVLTALGWRVAGHTPVDFASHLLELIEDRVDARVREELLEACGRHADRAIDDINFSDRRPSATGVACLAMALAECESIPSSSEKGAIWARLSGLCRHDLASREVREARGMLRASVSPREPRIKTKLAASRRSSFERSPVCVTQAARQA